MSLSKISLNWTFLFDGKIVNTYYILSRTLLFDSKIVNTYYRLTREQFNLDGESALLDNRLL